MSNALFDCALRALALRDHSETELRRKLSAKRFGAEEIEAALSRLRELSYLDDRRFARTFAESAMRNGRGFGAKLSQDLSRRGITPATIAEVLEELSGEFDERESLAELLERKFPRFEAATATEKEKRRVVGYLQRRGFTLSAIFSALKGAASD
ncbi:recombination regulator RecX [Geomonas sp. RF6]|uniref:regulatory protein RecX n=1 Tax=Geomonas sp. RF6 TaxID=2897342 RepID=UPI001E3B9CD5|nr:regulatory protein RecX [Geomonas sp. RF6]UFS71835.1 recombination regulator RecX [Geomonas sp. RF6]